VMYIGQRYNHGKYSIRYKLFIVGIMLFVIWDMFGSSCFDIIFSFLPNTPTVGATGGTRWEWYFRTSLDYWSTFFGMIFALNFPMMTKWLLEVEKESLRKQIFIKGSVGIVLLSALIWWVKNIFLLDKYEYNQENSYYGYIPLLTYIYFRNISVYFRSYHMGLLHFLGKYTLETYLLQHHVWLTSNAKTLLTLIPDLPLINFMVVSFIFIQLAKRTYQLTMGLRGALFPDNFQRCVNSLSILTTVMAGFLFLGYILKNAPAFFICFVIFTMSFGIIYWLRNYVFEIPSRDAAPLSGNIVNTLALVAVPNLIFLLISIIKENILAPFAERHIPGLDPFPEGHKAHEMDGSFAHPSRGIMVLFLAFFMIFSMDSYTAGIGMIIAKFGGVNFTWSDAYDSLHRKILRTTLPVTQSTSSRSDTTNNSDQQYTAVPTKEDDMEMTETKPSIN